MITPALDLQGAPQLIDRSGPETAPADKGGDFGAAFTASLSATRTVAGSSGSKEIAADLAQKLVPPGQPVGGSRTSASKTAAAPVKSISVAAGQKAGVAPAASLGDSAEAAGVDAIQKASQAVVSAVVTRVPDAILPERSGSQPTTSTSAVLSESQKIALASSKVLGEGSEDAKDLAGVAPQKLEVGGGGSGPTETAKVSQSGPKIEESQSAAKSKVSGQATEKIASQIALPETGAITSYIPVAALAVVPPAASSGAIPASSSESPLKGADSITAASGTASTGLSPQSAPPHLTATIASAGVPRSGALAAWNSIELVNASAARGAAGKAHELPAEPLQVEPATEGQSSVETTPSASAYTALAAGPPAPSLNRSTAVPASTAFTISGEQRVPSITNNLSQEGSRTRPETPGISPLKTVTANVSSNGSQTVVASSTALPVANVARTDTVRSSALAHSLPSPGPLVVPKQAPLPSAAQALSQSPAALPDTASNLRHTSNASLAQNSPSAATASSSQRPTVGGSQADERAKPIVRTASPTAPAASSEVSQRNTDRGVSSDGSGNVAGAHATGVVATAAADHLVPPESFNGTAVAGAVSSALSTQAVHQGTGSASGSIASLGQSARSGQDFLRAATGAATGAELGHPSNTLCAAIASEPHQTLEATSTSLEVGVRSGTQGWVKIRAEVGGEGEVSASLAAGSPSGEQMLKGQLPALNAYLHSEQMPVTASVAERTGIAHGAVPHDAGGTALQAGTGSTSSRDSSLFQGGANPGMEGQGNGPRSDARSSVPLQVTSLSDGQTRYETNSARAVASDAAPHPTTAPDSGHWLNVRV